jgi:lactate permease
MSTLRSWSPYIVLTIAVLLWAYQPANRFFETVTLKPAVPWLHNVIQRIPPAVAKQSPYGALYTFNWLASAGTVTFIAAFLAALTTGLGISRFFGVMAKTAKRLKFVELTIATNLALAYVMNYSGLTATLGVAFAQTGMLFPFFGTFLGCLGTFLTGSVNNSNALFGNLQLIGARAQGLNPVLMAAMNGCGANLGKMICPQSIAVATASAGMPREDEGRLFRSTMVHCMVLTLMMAAIGMLLAYVFPNVVPVLP